MKLDVVGKKVKIRKLKLSDAKDIYKNIKDKEVVKWTLSIPYPYPKDGAIKFIRKIHQKLKKKEEYAFGIVFKETGKVIGGISLLNIDWKNKNAEIGYWLGKNYWGKGLMTEAVSLTLKFGFKSLKLHRIFAKLFESNLGSKRVLEKAGFKFEGRFREAKYRNKKWHSELRYGALNSEYKQPHFKQP